MVNSYKTISEQSEGLYKDKGSKFISLAYPITDPDQVKDIVAGLKKEYYDARHHCFAWRVGWEGEHTRTVDDGEPSGTAGKPILGQLVSANVTNILVVVIRYFGGTKLGVAGLIKAYKEATIDALECATIVEREVEAYYELRFGYLEMNDVMKVIKDMPIKVHNQQFDNSCTMELSTRVDYCEQIVDKFEKVNGANLYFKEYK